ncbi:MAG: signal recognition particle protein Srp19 [Archaeoglobales archaeon]|nr:MAG: signal recognition particle protein Srp19 [Archaeoglobales archaeon]
MRECVIWTVNIDAKKSRREGRKVAKRYAVPNVKVDEIAKACRELGIPFRVEDKRYPKSWWEDIGRVVVPKEGSKIRIMERIAMKIREIRKR